MKVGVNLLNFGPGVSPDSLGRWAELAEALGYHLLMVSDHVAMTPDVEEKYPAPFYDPLVTLAWLAGTTKKVELGTTVIIVPYRHPVLLARMCANIDQISGGRFILGVGAGWAKQEFEVLGAPYGQRGAMTDDYLSALKALWSGQLVSYQGDFVEFGSVNSAPAPLRRPHPPIWVGGTSDRSLRRAVRLGDGWHPTRVRVDELENEFLPRLRRIAEEERRPVPDFCPRMRLLLTDSPMPEESRRAGEGTLEQVRRDLEGLQALDAKYVLLDTYFDDPEATRDHERSWRWLSVMAESAFDLSKESLR